MTIDGNWYMAECTSTKEPVPYMDGETFYLPVNIEFLEHRCTRGTNKIKKKC